MTRSAFIIICCSFAPAAVGPGGNKDPDAGASVRMPPNEVGGPPARVTKRRCCHGCALVGVAGPTESGVDEDGVAAR